jgi:hypothetical protein
MNIRTIGLLLGVASFAVAFVAGDAVAQGRRGGGQGPANYSVAAEVTVKGTVTFRDAKGFPMWAGRGRQ